MREVCAKKKDMGKDSHFGGYEKGISHQDSMIALITILDENMAVG